MATYPNVTPTTTTINTDAQYLRSNFISYQTITENNAQVSVPDYLNTTYLGVINSLTPTSYYTYSQGQQLTTQAFKGTGNTSTWWMIALLNGYINPLQMNNGDLVFIPNAAAAISKANTSVNPPAASTVSF